MVLIFLFFQVCDLSFRLEKSAIRLSCSGDLKNVDGLKNHVKLTVLNRSGIFEPQPGERYTVCEAHLDRLDQNFLKKISCIHPKHDEFSKKGRLLSAGPERNQARTVSLPMSKVIFETDGLLIPYDGWVCKSCKFEVFYGRYEKPSKIQRMDAPKKPTYESQDIFDDRDSDVGEGADLPQNLESDVGEGADLPQNLDSDLVEGADLPQNLDSNLGLQTDDASEDLLSDHSSEKKSNTQNSDGYKPDSQEVKKEV